jgi:hypothetical protein
MFGGAWMTTRCAAVALTGGAVVIIEGEERA